MPELELINSLTGSGANIGTIFLVYVLYRHEQRLFALENKSAGGANG